MALPPEMSRTGRLLHRLRDFESRCCLEADGQSHTYGKLVDEIERWGARLDSMKIGPGEVIGLRADYSLAAIASLFALLARDAITALIPRGGILIDYLSDARCAALVEIKTTGEFCWQPLPRPQSHQLLEQLGVPGGAGVVIFTTGSTGRPRAALHSFERLLGKFDRPGRAMRTLAFLLFDHVAGLDTLLYTLWNGGSLVIARKRDPHSILELLERHKVEVLPTSPSFLRLLCALEDWRDRDLSSLKVLTYGSEPMDSATLRRVNVAFPQARIIQKYGSTETGSPRTSSRGNDSLWLKIKCDGMESKVIDGVLWLRSEGTMLGYLNAPNPVGDTGWYCTGDRVEVDGEWIRFRGRMDEMILVGGEKVSPVEVEDVILELPFVRQVVIAGDPHALMGQVVVARVVLRPEAITPKNAIAEIRAHCRARLAAHKVPMKIDIVPENSSVMMGERQKLRRARTVTATGGSCEQPRSSETPHA